MANLTTAHRQYFESGVTELDTALQTDFSDNLSSSLATQTLASYEESSQPGTDEVEEQMAALLAILPPRITEAILQLGCVRDLIEVQLPLDEPPTLQLRMGCEETLDIDPLTSDEIRAICGHSTVGTCLGSRAGIHGTLHRMSHALDLNKQIPAMVYIRVGKAVKGCCHRILPLIAQLESTLLVGPPGTGKTTVLREFARLLREEHQRRVVVVDTSMELGGPNVKPLPCLGKGTRRMAVSDRLEQPQMMLSALQNFSAQAIVIDEIGTVAEVEAASTIAARGVQLVATAHAPSLRRMLDDTVLNELLGGVHTVTVGDQSAKMERNGRKTRLERMRAPVFRCLVELKVNGDWVVHESVANSVDEALPEKSCEHPGTPGGSTAHSRYAKLLPASSEDFHPGPVHPAGAPASTSASSAAHLGHLGHPAGASAPVSGPAAAPSHHSEVQTASRMRRSIQSGSAYILQFDGGVSNPACRKRTPGAGAATLARIRKDSSLQDCLPGREIRHWQAFLEASAVDLCEVGGLLIGLTGLLSLLREGRGQFLQPELVIVQGDSKTIVEMCKRWVTNGDQFVRRPGALGDGDAIFALQPEIHRVLLAIKEQVPNLMLEFRWKPRSVNTRADELATQARQLQITNIVLDPEILSKLGGRARGAPGRSQAAAAELGGPLGPPGPTGPAGPAGSTWPSGGPGPRAQAGRSLATYPPRGAAAPPPPPAGPKPMSTLAQAVPPPPPPDGHVIRPVIWVK